MVSGDNYEEFKKWVRYPMDESSRDDDLFEISARGVMLT